MMKAHLAAFILLASGSIVMAASDDVTALQEAFDKCQAAATTTVDMKECNNEAYGKADTLLNATYKSIVATLSAPEADEFEKRDNAEKLRRLKAAQLAWITLRDAQCELEGTTMLGGTGEGVVIGGCLYTETVERVRGLRKLFEEQP